MYLFLAGEMELHGMSIITNDNGSTRNNDARLESTGSIAPNRGMVLPFTPLVMTFDGVNYFVDMPSVSIPAIFCTILKNPQR